jgi:chloramphenicol 3-O-phosphotransferase
VLNGASSAGKTCIAQALRPLLGADCVSTGFDDILERAQPFGPEGGALAVLRRGFRAVLFKAANDRLQLFKQLHREVAAHARAGRPVIIDTALMDRRELLDVAECFAPFGGFHIGVKPPLAVSE